MRSFFSVRNVEFDVSVGSEASKHTLGKYMSANASSYADFILLANAFQTLLILADNKVNCSTVARFLLQVTQSACENSGRQNETV